MPNDLDLSAFKLLLDSLVSVFNVIPLEDALIAMRNGKLPPRAAVITFDDGYPTWINGVATELQARNLHATFYITIGQFSGQPLWHERIINAVRQCKSDVLKLDHPAYIPLPLDSLRQRTEAILYLEQSLKYLSLSARNDLISNLESLTGSTPDQVPVMSLSDLRKLNAMGFGIGAHTDNHPILQYCDTKTLCHEIGQVREELGNLAGCSVTSFAYPNGHPFADFSSRHVEFVKKSGYTNAVTTQRGVAKVSTSPFQIPRFTPWGKNPGRIAWQLGCNLLTKPYCVDE